MKRVLSNNIATGVRQPYTKVTHEHYNAMIEEASKALAEAIVPDPTVPTILYGCENQDSPNADIKAGAIYLDGEIYLCDAFVDASISNTIVGNITTTYAPGDPILFSDNSSYNVHQIKRIVWSDAASGSGDFDYADCATISISKDYVNIASGLTFKYVDDGGTTRTIVASPTLTIFKYRLIGKTCHLQINIADIDTVTSNSGTGHSAIIIEGLPVEITPKTSSVYSVLFEKHTAGVTLGSDVLLGRIATTTLTAQTVGGANTSGSSTNTRLYGSFTYEVS